jgi:hypothetical protein
MTHTCGRCGRQFDQFEASIGDVPYCHPFLQPAGERSCYQEQSYGMTFDGTYPTVSSEFLALVDATIEEHRETLRRLGE